MKDQKTIFHYFGDFEIKASASRHQHWHRYRLRHCKILFLPYVVFLVNIGVLIKSKFSKVFCRKCFEKVANLKISGNFPSKNLWWSPF